MFVCICHAVKESQIQQAIADGHDSLEALQQELAVATCCGGCLPMIEDYLDQAKLTSTQPPQIPSRSQSHAHLYIQVA